MINKSLRSMAILFCITLILSVFTVFSHAVDEENFVEEIGDIDTPYASPEINGVISGGEGWSEGKYFDRTTIDGCWGGEDPRLSGYLYRAWDENGIYVAADLTIPDMTLSTGLDEKEIDGSILHGYNGDVFILTFDPMKKMLDVGMGDECGPWYCIGIFEGNEMKMYRTQYGEKEITHEVKLAGAVTENGWRFETFLPWDLIISDIEIASMDDVQLKKEEIAKGGTEVNMHFIYLDRWFDIEMGGVETYSRYASICTTLPDGRPGTISSAITIKTYGIHLHFLPKPGEETTADTTTAAATETTAQTAQTAAGETTAAASGTASSQTGAVSPTTGSPASGSSSSAGTSSSGASKTSSAASPSSQTKTDKDSAQTSSGNVGVPAAQTGDGGIAIAGIAAVAAVAGFILLLKRKNVD